MIINSFFCLYFMFEIKNNSYKKLIKDNLDDFEGKLREDFFEIISTFEKVYIVGGFVRDSILQILYDYNFPINDLDVLIEDSDFDNVFKKYQKNKSRFGGLKFNYGSFEMDVFEMSNIFYLKDFPREEKTLESFLERVDVSTSAFAYDFGKDRLYENCALKDVKNKKINLLNDQGEVAPTIVRLILHSDKMGFEIGESGLKYIKENYSPEIDSEIRAFLMSKKIPHLSSLIDGKLYSIL